MTLVILCIRVRHALYYYMIISLFKVKAMISLVVGLVRRLRGCCGCNKETDAKIEAVLQAVRRGESSLHTRECCGYAACGFRRETIS